MTDASFDGLEIENIISCRTDEVDDVLKLVGSMELRSRFTFSGSDDERVEIDFDNRTITTNVDWDEAAKLFWDSVEDISGMKVTHD